MHIDAIGSCLIVVFNLVFWVFTLTQRPLSSVAKAYFGWSLFITLWAIGYGVTLAGFFSYEATLMWNRYCQAMATMIGPFFFKFGCSTAGTFPKYEKFYKSYLIFGLINAILLLLTPYYVKGLWEFGDYKYQPLGGPLYSIFTLFFVYCTSHAFLVVAKSYSETTGVRRSQVRLFLLATGIAYFGGVTLFFQGYGLPIPTHGVFCILAYVIIIGYSVHKYKFMDISVLVRKTLVFAGLLAFVFTVFTAATIFVREILSQFLGAHNYWSYGISIFFIVLGYDHIRNFLINLTDKYLFQKKYNYQQLLKDASRGMAKIESLEHLLQLVVHFITMRMRVESAGVLTRRTGEGAFTLKYQRGYKKKYLEYHVQEVHPLIQYLLNEKEPLDIENVKENIELGGKSSESKSGELEYDFEAIREKMAELEASCCVPSFLSNELRNILVLGAKKSGEIYTEEDHNLLYTLAQESAISIENARLYDEAINKTKELEKINLQLENAKSRLTVALNETEAANKQLQDTQAQLIHEQKMATLGRLAASVGHEVNNPLTILSMNISRAILKYRKNKDLKVETILDIFQKMEQNISRIKAVVNTLTGLLKKSEKGKFEPLSLKLVLEETLPLVQFQTYLDNLAGTEVEFNVPGNTPLIRGDLERLQEVFLNLFINAYHAMEGRRLPKIVVRAELTDGEDGQMVAVHFQDNGKGMNEATQKKIFAYGYTTKGPGKGSGMGLYMVKYIIELHGGTIYVTSQEGVGTTFTLTLPVYEESGSIATEGLKTGS